MLAVDLGRYLCPCGFAEPVAMTTMKCMGCRWRWAASAFRGAVPVPPLLLAGQLLQEEDGSPLDEVDDTSSQEEDAIPTMGKNCGTIDG